MTNGAGPGGTTGMTGAPTNPNPQSDATGDRKRQPGQPDAGRNKSLVDATCVKERGAPAPLFLSDHHRAVAAPRDNLIADGPRAP